MSQPPVLDSTTRPHAGRTLAFVGISAIVHAVLLLMILFDVVGIGGGFGLGIGPGGGAGLGEKKRRQIYSLEDLPQVVRPQDAKHDQEVKDLVVARTPDAVVIPQQVKPKSVSTSPVVQFARPVTPLGAGTDLGARFASTGAGTGGFGVGGGGGGGFSLGSLGISLDSAFGKYVGSLRKVGLDVAIVVDATGSMQNVIDEIKHRLDDLVFTMQRLVPTARIGAVAYRD